MKTNTKLRRRSTLVHAVRVGKMMCLAIALAVTPLAADLAHANLNQQIEEQDWRDALIDVPSDDAALMARSTELLTDASKAQKAGANDEALRTPGNKKLSSNLTPKLANGAAGQS